MSAERGGAWARIAAFVWFGAAFCLIYGLADLIGARIETRFDMSTPLDRAIPYVPAFAVAYLAIDILLPAPALLIDTLARCRAFYATLALETAVATPFFLLAPAAAIPVEAAEKGSAMWFADVVNLNFNYFPSLHVAFAISCGMAPGWRDRPLARLAVWPSIAAIVASTLFTRQHYVVDVIGGALLAWGVMRFVFPRLARWFASRC